MKTAIQTNVWSPERHQDLNGLLAEIAAAGYDGFEIGAHRIDLTQPDLFRAAAASHRLAPAGLHTHGELHSPQAMKVVADKVEAAAHFARAVEASCVLISGRPKDGKTEEDFRLAAQSLNRLGEICGRAGAPLYYHTHNWELEHDLRELRALIGYTDPALVSLALDVGWIKRAGYDPVAVIGEFIGRIRYFHIKDTHGDQWTEVGSGAVDFAAVLAAIRSHGFDGWLTVERDEVLPNAFESAKQSREHLKGLGI